MQPERPVLMWLVLLVFLLINLAEGAETINTDLLVVGGTESGCAAAVQAARMGVTSITIVNDISWLGGQFSAEALTAIDENRGPAGYGHGVPFPRSGLFKEVIDRIEAINLTRYGHRRPGNTRVITTCRPADAERAFRDMLQPYVRSGQVRIFSRYVPAETEVTDGTLQTVRFQATQSGRQDMVVHARLTIDASDWGDVVKLSGADYEFGPDLKSKYDEPLAPTSRTDYPVTDMNPITYCMVVEETDQYVPISKPAHYDPRSYHKHAYPRDPMFLYASRRLVDRYHYANIEHPDVLLLCFPAFDYPLDLLPQRVVEQLEATEKGASGKNIVQMTPAQRQLVFDDAKRYSLGFLYYLQTVVHDSMQDKTHSFRRFQLVDEFATGDRMPPKPYVRESLRLKAMTMMRQQDVTGHGGRSTNFATVMYHDGVACWQFEFDFHPTGRRFLDNGDSSGPWTNYFRPGRTWGPPYSGRALFPLRSLVPRKLDGLIGAQKNLGYSSIVSSAVRLHDQSMAIGQAAGAVAAVSLDQNVEPRVIPFDRAMLSQIWQGLCARKGQAAPQILWPFADVAPEHAAFEAINLLAIHGALPQTCSGVEFRPDQDATRKWIESVVARSREIWDADRTLAAPAGEMTRGEFAIRWWRAVRLLPLKPYQRLDKNDADGDGIADSEDPLPLSAAPSSWPAYQVPQDEDGNPDPVDAPNGRVRLFNFTGVGTTGQSEMIGDHGLPFDVERGFGWTRDISANHRRRGKMTGTWRDTFLFTRSHDRWDCVIDNGRYKVTVCIGDSGFEQVGQNVTVEGTSVFRDHVTGIGQFAEKTVSVEVQDGRLSIEIGAKGSTTNTCLDWVRIVRAG